VCVRVCVCVCVCVCWFRRSEYLPYTLSIGDESHRQYLACTVMSLRICCPFALTQMNSNIFWPNASLSRMDNKENLEPFGRGWFSSLTKNGPLRYSISWTMIAKLYTSPFCVPVTNWLPVLFLSISSSGAVHSMSDIKTTTITYLKHIQNVVAWLFFFAFISFFVNFSPQYMF